MKLSAVVLVQLAFVLATVPIARAASASTVILSEVLPDPGFTSDANGEYIELFNPTGSAVNLAHYKVCDLEECTQIFGSIPSGGYFVLCRNADYIDLCDDTTTISLKNGGDTITLKDTKSNVLDSISYPSASGHADCSFERGSNDASNPAWAYRAAGYTPGSGSLTDESTPSLSSRIASHRTLRGSA